MKYSYTMSRINHDGELIWVAKSIELKNCYGVGDTQAEALEELEMNEIAWLETAKARGFDIPEIKVEAESSFSGKLTLRLSPKEHEAASKQASIQNISLNQYISDAVVAYTAKEDILNKVNEKLNQVLALAQKKPEMHELHIHIEDTQFYQPVLGRQKRGADIWKPMRSRISEVLPC